MENLLKWMEPSIIARIEELNETVEHSPAIAEKVIDNQDKFEQLKKALPKEHIQTLQDVYYNHGCQLVSTEDIYYRKGLEDGIRLAAEMNQALGIAQPKSFKFNEGTV